MKEEHKETRIAMLRPVTWLLDEMQADRMEAQRKATDLHSAYHGGMVEAFQIVGSMIDDLKMKIEYWDMEDWQE